MIKIVAVSDIHEDRYLCNKLSKQTGDFLFVCGDLTNYGKKTSLDMVLKYISKSDFKYKVIILGNHEVENGYEYCKKNYPNIYFLDNEIIELGGYKIYGTPYTRRFADLGYQYDDEECVEKTIPKSSVDIILTHEPPIHPNLSVLSDWFGRAIDIGNKELKNYIENTDKEMLVLCGHCHEHGGKNVIIGKSKCYNVATKIAHIDL